MGPCHPRQIPSVRPCLFWDCLLRDNMNITTKFIIFQLVVLIPFFIGSLLQKKMVKAPQTLIRMNLICLEPLIALWSIWGLSLNLTYIALPISGFFLVLAGGVLGYLFMPFVRLQGKSKATFIISSSLANHGFTMGGFLCYLFLGERGLGLALIFTSYFMPYIFFVVFPYARSLSSKERFGIKFLQENIINIQNMPLYAIIVALCLQLFGIKRPNIFFPIDVILLISVGMYYFALGINFNVKNIFSCFRENVSIIAIKFLLIPLMTLITLKFIHLDNLVAEVILIESFMPAAIYSVVASVLFNLDAKLATNLFVINTIVFIAFAFPAFFIFQEHFAG
jgi:hypothetical protein